MSDTDSFIDEVNEEMRRDRLYGYLRRYGWIAVLAVVLIVGGATWNEWRKAQTIAEAEEFGDEITSALTQPTADARLAAVENLETDNPQSQAVLDLIAAAELAAADRVEEAAARLNGVAENGDIAPIYRQIAGFKALLVQTDTLDAETRRAGFDNFAVPGQPLRTLAEEQLALIDIETGNRDAALDRLRSLSTDVEASVDLQQRAMQVIVALGGDPVDLAPPAAEN